MKFDLLYSSFTVVILASLLNLNGVTLMALGVSQMWSSAILFACLVLVWKLGAIQQSIAMWMLLLSLASYLLFAFLFGVIFNNDQSTLGLAMAYGTTILMLIATGSYLQYALHAGKIDRVLRLYRNISLVAAGSVLSSPLLYSVFLFVPPSFESRLGGFFGNPNEAGLMACAALAFVMFVPFSLTWIQISALAAATIAAVLTFSKTAWLVLLLLWAIYLLRQSRRSFFLLFTLFTAIPALALIDLQYVINWLLNNPYFELTLTQERRIQEIMFISYASGGAENTLTGRDFLWKYGFEQIMESPLAGYGLGSFHHIIGGLNQGEVWQGVHNVYLMFWGEAGIIPFICLSITTAMIGWKIVTRAVHPTVGPIALIVFLNLQVNHNVLISRYFVVLVALVVVLGTSRQSLAVNFSGARSAHPPVSRHAP